MGNKLRQNVDLSDLERFAYSEMQKYLQCFGIYSNKVCYETLTECVAEAIKYVRLPGHIGEIYQVVGRRCGKSQASIERGIRWGIQNSVVEKRFEIINGFFGYKVYCDGNMLTNSEVIGLISSRIFEDYCKSIASKA